MDKFNEIWKDRFNQGDLPDANWNTPDAEVWAAILPHVPTKRERPLLFLWIFLGLSLLLIALLIYFYPEQKMISHLSGQKAKLPFLALIDQDPTPDKVTKEKNNIVAFYADHSTKQILTSAVIPARKDPRVIKNISLQSSMDIALQRRTESRGIDRLKPENGKPRMGDSKAGQDLIEEQFDSHSESALLSPLHYLPTLDAFFQTKKFTPSPSIVKPVRLDLPKNKKIKIALQSGSTYWQHLISDQYTNALSAFDFNYADNWGWNVELGAAYTINDKLALRAGLVYESVQTYSSHNSSLNYNPNQEQGGQAINDYEATLATPYGTARASFRFSREEELGEDPIELLVDFHSEHRIQNVSVPVGLAYYPLGQQKFWQPVLSIGMGTNYLFGLSNQIASVDTHHDAIKFAKPGNASFADPELDRLHFDLRIGAGVEYRLPAQIQIGITGTWAKGLNPVFKQDDYQTKINRVQIQARISKRF